MKEISVFDFNIFSFLEKLILSINNVNSDFFQIPTEYKPDGISRERVFCYELYHQLRMVLGNDYPFSLHGELDKSGHISFPRVLQGIPDFLVHQPGTHKGNMVIMEVKGIFNSKNIILDLKKINGFISHPEINYRYGVFILYNYTFDDFMTRISIDRLRQIPCETDQKIYLICAVNNQRLECASLSFIRRNFR